MIDRADSINQFRMLGVRIHSIDLLRAVSLVDDWAGRHDSPRIVAVTGMHGVMEAQGDHHFRNVLNSADLVLPDGISTVWFSRLGSDVPLPDRVPGPDFMEAFCKATGSKHRHFLYGGGPGVARRLAERLETDFGVRVVGTYTPPFRPLSADERTHLKSMVAETKPDIVWVGLSTPKQERWMDEFRHHLKVPVMLGVGAAFDFLAGLKPRAPKWIGRAGFEWLYRFCAEPRRMWPRVAVLGPRFLRLAARDVIARRIRD